MVESKLDSMSIHTCSVWLIIGLASVVLGGCGPDQTTVWSTSVPSPDGELVAYARAVTGGGFGGDYSYTEVSLGRKSNAQSVVALVFADNCAFPARNGVVHMKWATASHLDVAHTHCTESDVRVAEVMGATITVHKQKATTH